MAGNKMAVVALLLISMLAFSATPAMSIGCVEDCINRCSNGKNLVSCGTMCAAACVKSAVDGTVLPSDPYQG